jgi:hypothetical protein
LSIFPFEFNYLGLLLTKTGNFKRAIKTLADKGTKAMYEILKRGKFHNLLPSAVLYLYRGGSVSIHHKYNLELKI